MLGTYYLLYSASVYCLMYFLFLHLCCCVVYYQIVLGKGLDSSGLTVKSLKDEGYQAVFVGIGKLSG